MGTLTINPERTLYLNEEISDAGADKIIGEINNLNSSPEEIFLTINSRGGNYIGATKIYDRIKINPRPVIGVVSGDVFSAAVILLQGCHKRYATRNSRLLVHNLCFPLTLKLKANDKLDFIMSLVEKELAEIKRKEDNLVAILKERVTISSEALSELLDSNRVLTPEEAKNFGLIDEIID